MKFNQEKTKELIDELKSGGHISGIEDLSRFIQKTGVIVSEHIGRRRSHIEVNPKVYGVNLSEKADETKKFFEEHVRQGKMNFIPESFDRELSNAESSVRIARRRAAVGFDDKFLPMDAYNTFLRKFEEHKKRYFETRDKIVDQWDELMERFERSLRSSLDDLNAIDKEVVIASILAKIPTKDEYRGSFYMDLRVKPFPVMDNLDIFDDSVREQIEEGMADEAVSTMYEIIGSCLNDMFGKVADVLSTIERGNKVNAKSRTALADCAKRIKQKNVLSNAKVEEYAGIVDKLGKVRQEDEMAEQGEMLLAFIAGYADELGISNTINTKNSPLTLDELLEINEMLSGDDQAA